jgi:MFS family permease
MTKSRGLFIGKALYFCIYAAIGILVPFLNIYYKDIGLSGTQIGLVNTMGPLIAIFSGLLWGLLCDRLGRIRTLLGTAAIGAILSILGLSTMRAFLGIVATTAVFNLFGSAIIPLVDSYNLALLGESRDRYGHQRIWGTIGFLVSSMFAGFVLERVGLHGVFGGYILCVGLFFIALLALPPLPARMGRAVFSGFAQMIRQPVWIILAIAIILLMIANSSWLNFIGITMNRMGARDGLIGQAWSMGALSEIPVMFFGTRILQKLGAKRMMILGFVFYGVRLVLYAIMLRPEWVLGINLLHGFSFGFYWIGVVNYVSQITPEHLRATGQSMLATFFNMASVIGGSFIGVAFDTLGSSRMYILAAGIAWTAVLLFVIVDYRLKKG